MAKIKVTRTDGTENEYQISPLVQYGFEVFHKKSFIKAFVEDQKASDLYWVAWECQRRSGETVPMFGEKFIETLANVEVVADDLPLD